MMRTSSSTNYDDTNQDNEAGPLSKRKNEALLQFVQALIDKEGAALHKIAELQEEVKQMVAASEEPASPLKYNHGQEKRGILGNKDVLELQLELERTQEEMHALSVEISRKEDAHAVQLTEINAQRANLRLELVRTNEELALLRSNGGSNSNSNSNSNDSSSHSSNRSDVEGTVKGRGGSSAEVSEGEGNAPSSSFSSSSPVLPLPSSPRNRMLTRQLAESLERER
jgi:hypothetical protein